MSNFVGEADNTAAVDKVSTTYQAIIHKAGGVAGWATTQFPTPFTQGKYRIELEILDSLSNNTIMIGFAQQNVNLKAKHVGVVADSWSYYCSNGTKYIAGAATPFGPAATKGDKITLKFSFAKPTVKFYKNGRFFGSLPDIPFQSNTVKLCVSVHSHGDIVRISLNTRD